MSKFVVGKRKIFLLILLLLVLIPILVILTLTLKPKNNIPPDPLKQNAEKITSGLKSVISNNPKAVDPSGKEGWTEKVYLNNWEYCQTGDPNWSGDLNAEKESACRISIFKMYNNYKEFNDPAFYDMAKEMYDYAEKALPALNFDILKKSLEKYEVDIK